MIEIMVVIGIILVLLGVSIAGMSQVSKHSKTQRTQTALETARSLWAGYVASDSTQTKLKALYNTGTLSTLMPTQTTVLDQSTVPGSLVACKGVNGVKQWSTIAASTDQNIPKALDYTVQAMQIFLRVPENRDIMDKLPAEAKFVLLDGYGKPLTNAVPLLADGNGEPILFVPPAGLSNVTVTGNTNAGTIQADGRWHPYPSTGTDPVPNITRTPFFASAGSDRDFSAGDDNAYTVHQ